MNLSEFFAFIYDKFCNADLEEKFIYLIMIIMPFVCAILFFHQLYVRYKDIKSNTSPNEIKYLDFQQNGINIICSVKECGGLLLYSDINKLKLTFETTMAQGKYGQYPCITGLKIGIIDNCANSYDIFHAPVKISNIYKLIYFGQFVKKITYKYTGRGTIIKEKIEKQIKTFINNNYRETFSMIIQRSFVSIIVSICFIIFLFSIYITTPTITSAKDREYISYIETGYRYYQIREIDNAL